MKIAISKKELKKISILALLNIIGIILIVVNAIYVGENNNWMAVENNPYIYWMGFLHSTLIAIGCSLFLATLIIMMKFFSNIIENYSMNKKMKLKKGNKNVKSKSIK